LAVPILSARVRNYQNANMSHIFNLMAGSNGNRNTSKERSPKKRI
jgi:hypothetical protein